MSIDLSKLELWTLGGDTRYYAADPRGYPVLVAEDDDDIGKTAVEFAVLARQAFAGDPESLAWWEANRRKS